MTYVYHKHIDGSGNIHTEDVIYSTSNPGGCYVAAGHTHNKTGTCPVTGYKTTTKQAYCGQFVYGKNINTGEEYFYCNQCGASGGGIGDHYVSVPVTDYNNPIYGCELPVNTWKPFCGRTANVTIDAVLFNNIDVVKILLDNQ